MLSKEELVSFLLTGCNGVDDKDDEEEVGDSTFDGEPGKSSKVTPVACASDRRLLAALSISVARSTKWLSFLSSSSGWAALYSLYRRFVKSSLTASSIYETLALYAA